MKCEAPTLIELSHSESWTEKDKYVYNWTIVCNVLWFPPEKLETEGLFESDFYFFFSLSYTPFHFSGNQGIGMGVGGEIALCWVSS